MAEYIEREAFKAEIRRLSTHYLNEWDTLGVLAAADRIPAVDVRLVVRGEWGYRWKIHGDGRRPTELYPCSECGYENTSAIHFCPNCGAQMIGGDDDA